MSEHETVARELVRALRGKRSAAWLSRRMGFDSNVLHRWESGLREPTLAQVLELARSVGLDVRDALVRFDANLEVELARPLEDLELGSVLLRTSWTRSTAELARRARMTPSALERVMRGQTSVRLARFLELLEIATGRMLEWVAVFVDPERLPSARDPWRRLEHARDAARLAPISEGVLALVETADYRTLREHPKGYFASRLGVDLETEAEVLELLLNLGWVSDEGGVYRVTAERQVDTRKLPPEAQGLIRETWVRDAARRLANRSPGARASYVVFSTSEERLAQVLAVMGRAYADVRAILREQEPEDAVNRAVVLMITACALDGLPLSRPQNE